MSLGLPHFWKHLPTAELFGLAGEYRRVLRGNGAMGSAYRVGSAVVAVRLWQATGSGPVHYLIDDDIRAGIADERLPDGYRKRLEAAFRASIEVTAPDRIESVITPSERLAGLYSAMGKRVLRLDPAWDVSARVDVGHFEGQAMRVACLGSRSHLADFDILHEALEDPRRTWEFHHFMGDFAPDWLKRLERVVAHAPMPWRGYRRNLRRLRFHLCVYPMLPTPFNLARSCNKVMEHAMVGAGSLFSACVPFAPMVEASGGGLLVADDDWPRVLRNLTADVGRCRELADRSHQLGRETATRALRSQHDLWAGIARA